MVEIRIEDENKKDDVVTINPGTKDKKPVEKQTIIIKERTARKRAKKRSKPKTRSTIIVKTPVQKKTKKTSKPKKKAKKRTVRVAKKKTVDQMVKVLEANQNLVDEMIKLNTGVMDNVITMSSSLTLLTERMDSFLQKDRREELPSTVPNDVDQRIRELENRLNTIITAISQKR